MASRKVKDAAALFEDGELAAHPPTLARQGFEMWNEAAKRNSWATAAVLDNARQSAMKRAIQTHGGIAGFRAALEKIERSDFCMGRVKSKDGRPPFKANLDWFLRPVTVRQVIEDFYNRGGDKPISLAAAMAPGDEWASVMRSYEPGRWWPSGRGPRPEEPGCRVTPSILIAWRKKRGIVVEVPKVETRADRLRHSIASYRKVENYKRANELEQELADLEKRAAVLVPAPDVAHLTGSPPEAPSLVNRPKHTVSDIDFEEAPPWDEIPEGDETQAEP